MNTEDRFLLHRARNLAVTLDERGKGLEASVVTELIERLEGALSKFPGCDTADAAEMSNLARAAEPHCTDDITIEREVFKTLVETSLLFNFWIENVGRLSFMGEAADKQLDTIKFKFVLNPPGRRSQFPREAVIQALMDIKQVLSVPHYG